MAALNRGGRGGIGFGSHGKKSVGMGLKAELDETNRKAFPVEKDT